MNELINYIILGMIQGLTEFFPVSSSGHLVLFQDFLEEFEIEEDGKKLQKYKILAEELAARAGADGLTLCRDESGHRARFLQVTVDRDAQPCNFSNLELLGTRSAPGR